MSKHRFKEKLEEKNSQYPALVWTSYRTKIVSLTLGGASRECTLKIGLLSCQLTSSKSVSLYIMSLIVAVF